MTSNLIYDNNTISLSQFLFFNDSLILVFAVVITKIFKPIAEIAIIIRIKNKEAKAKIETHPVIAETRISNCSI